MLKSLTVLAVLLAACASGATGPQGLDPTVLVTNPSPTDTVFFTWQDGQSILTVDTIVGPTSRCEHFLARPDSAAFDLLARHWYSTGPAIYRVAALWFNPADHPAWTVSYDAGFLETDVGPTVPC